MAFIVATSVGFPPYYYPQEMLASALRKYCLAMELDFDLDSIDRFFTNVAIKGRYFALPLDSFYEPPALGETLNKTIEAAVNLAEGTVRSLLEQTAFDPKNVSQLTSVTVTPAIPAIDARLMNQIAFSPNLKRMPLGGVGCMGGALGLSRVADYLQGHFTEAAILLTVELSSALWQGSLQRDLYSLICRLSAEPSLYSDIIMAIVTAALFADGAGAALIVGRDHPLVQPGQPQVIATRSVLLPDTLHLMGLDTLDTGFRNILKPEVADFVKVGLRQAIDPLLAEHDLSVDKISYWIVHPGGPKIMTAVEEEFGLDDRALWLSREALAQVGNISSVTVLYMLNKILSGAQPSPGSYGLIVAMGPGFAQEVILLQW